MINVNVSAWALELVSPPRLTVSLERGLRLTDSRLLYPQRNHGDLVQDAHRWRTNYKAFLIVLKTLMREAPPPPPPPKTHLIVIRSQRRIQACLCVCLQHQTVFPTPVIPVHVGFQHFCFFFLRLKWPCDISAAFASPVCSRSCSPENKKAEKFVSLFS